MDRGKSSAEGNTTGYAGGWSVWPSDDGAWEWSAYGGIGTATGRAASEAEAIAAASGAKQHLDEWARANTNVVP